MEFSWGKRHLGFWKNANWCNIAHVLHVEFKKKIIILQPCFQDFTSSVWRGGIEVLRSTDATADADARIVEIETLVKQTRQWKSARCYFFSFLLQNANKEITFASIYYLKNSASPITTVQAILFLSTNRISQEVLDSCKSVLTITVSQSFRRNLNLFM